MRTILFFGISVSLLFAGCRDNHFITDKAYRNKVDVQFEKQKELAKNRSRQLFGVFDHDVTLRETEALKFLYAYSSLSDLADYNGEFFLHNIRLSFAARDTFSWGKKVPENIFRHFVLPVRVNNENLDSSRWVFFAELKDRIKKLSMKEAVLEVNHWCHEKVTYRGSDGRTSSPLASVKTALGRCGEESTFTVAALRSVGIPARQCYTPRWAHSDDNHAWVEVWVDGKWHFIGACEPEASLDLAWFTKPAKRGMLVNTTVFGDYEGPEDVLQKDMLFTKINVLENYAPTKKVFARITDTQGRKLDSASVEFQLYNYAEFYPLYKTLTGKDGFCSFKTGFGDLLVWASKDGKYGFTKLDVRKNDTVTIALDRKGDQTFDLELDMIPPAELEMTSTESDSAKQRNSERLTFEDGIRISYESTFIDSLKSERFARLVSLDPDTLWEFMHKSRGNWRELTSFITQVTPDKQPFIFPLLENISEKDLRDIDTIVLLDNLNNSDKYIPLTADKENFTKNILSPRVDNEFLKPFKQFFQTKFDTGFIRKSRKDPNKIVDWIRINIVVNNSANYSRSPLTPIGVFELKVADAHSIDICFVAICRSFGIPARLDPATRVPQYLSQNQWHDIYLFEKKQNAGLKGTLVLLNPATNDKQPEYTMQYTLETYQDGFFRTLDYEGSPLVQSYPCKLDVPSGPCMMVTGNRMTNGSVLTRLKVFNVKTNETLTQPIVIRKYQLQRQEYGRINPALFNNNNGPGLIIAWVDPDKEPTKHLMADLRQKKREFGKWKGRILMVFTSEEQMKTFIKREGAFLPVNVEYSFQSTFQVKLSDIITNRSSLKNMPVVLFMNVKGGINYLSEGYRIGIGDELLTFMR